MAAPKPEKKSIFKPSTWFQPDPHTPNQVAKSPENLQELVNKKKQTIDEIMRKNNY